MKEYNITLEEIDKKIEDINDDLLRTNDAMIRSALREEHRKYVSLRKDVVESQERIEIEKEKAVNAQKNAEKETKIKNQEVTDKNKLGKKELAVKIVSTVTTGVFGFVSLYKTFGFDKEGKMITSTAGKGILTKGINALLPGRNNK